MSAAASGAATGAASGAAAGTMVMPGWGTAIGAGLGAISGGLGGLGADKRKKAEAAARRRLRRAVNQYGRSSQALANDTVQTARTADDDYRRALSAHLAGQPDMAAALQQNVGQEQGLYDAGIAEAFQGNLADPGISRGGGAEQAWMRRQQADGQRRATEATQPLAFRGAVTQTRMSDQDYRNKLQTELARIGLRPEQANRLRSLQQLQNYGRLAAAQGRYQSDRTRAGNAGAGATLAGGLVNAAGQGLAAAYMGGGAPAALPVSGGGSLAPVRYDPSKVAPAGVKNTLGSRR